MTSLLSAAHLVKPEWLSELLDLSLLNPRESPRALEHTFALPPEGRFRPGFAAALSSELKTLRLWEPNEARLNMLKGYRFVFAGEKGLEVPAGYREVVKRGGAEYEAFSVNAGVVRWRKALTRAKALAEEKNAKVVLVADGGAMELVVGADEWDEIVSVAKRYVLLSGSNFELSSRPHAQPGIGVYPTREYLAGYCACRHVLRGLDCSTCRLAETKYVIHLLLCTFLV